ncbi:MAG: histidine kinase, partial [Halobacteriaceae archaeon]
MVAGMHPIRLGYVVVFSLTAVACFAAISRSRGRIEDPETRWGLNSLLATSGLWAAFHVGRILAPSPDLKLTFYVLGLTAGLATVGAWLYFCSAYAGESYHRQPLFRRLALGLYL